MSKNINISTEIVMDLARKLPIALKKQLMNEWQQKTDVEEKDEQYLPDFDIEGWDEPINLEEYALNPKALPMLRDLWKDELPAEELIDMLTK
jgi:hypothetical protein